MTFKNEQGITKIKFTQNAQCFCPLGNDWYTNQFTVEIVPNELLADYVDVEKFIRKEISGKTLILEEAVSTLFNYIQTEIKPKYLKVSSYGADAVHFPVTVTKETI